MGGRFVLHQRRGGHGQAGQLKPRWSGSPVTPRITSRPRSTGGQRRLPSGSTHRRDNATPRAVLCLFPSAGPSVPASVRSHVQKGLALDWRRGRYCVRRLYCVCEVNEAGCWCPAFFF